MLYATKLFYQEQKTVLSAKHVEKDNIVSLTWRGRPHGWLGARWTPDCHSEKQTHPVLAETITSWRCISTQTNTSAMFWPFACLPFHLYTPSLLISFPEICKKKDHCINGKQRRCVMCDYLGGLDQLRSPWFVIRGGDSNLQQHTDTIQSEFTDCINSAWFLFDSIRDQNQAWHIHNTSMSHAWSCTYFHSTELTVGGFVVVVSGHKFGSEPVPWLGVGINWTNLIKVPAGLN